MPPVSADERRGHVPGAVPRTVHVWDRFVRVFHWTLAAAFFVAYFTEDDLLAVHVWAGYLVGGLIVLRLAWGFVGPRHARFTDFVCGPAKAWRYLIDLVALRSARHLGHSPAGGMMVVLLLAGLAVTVWSWMETYAIEEGRGPLAARRIDEPAAAGSATDAGLVLVSDSRESGTGADRGETVWEAVHETVATLVFVLVLLHLGGVLIASLVHRENLVCAMITGDKRAE